MLQDLHSLVNWLLALELKDWVEYIGVVISLFLAFRWLYRRYSLDSAVEGRWEGTLECQNVNMKNVKLECILIVSKCPSRTNKGLLYYEEKTTVGSRRRGVDKIIEYKQDWKFFFKPVWKPKFTREMHIMQEKGAWLVNVDEISYQWNCTVKNRLRNTEISAEVTGNDMVYAGRLKKS